MFSGGIDKQQWTVMGLMLKKRDGALICENTAFLYNNCNCFSTFFSFFVKVQEQEQ